MEYEKANRVRTHLLVEVYNENNYYIKKCEVAINSQLPRDILKKYDQFESTFDNPTIHGSVRRRSQTVQVLKSLQQPSFQADNRSHNSDVSSLDFADFLASKKICCGAKKIKHSHVGAAENENNKSMKRGSNGKKRKLSDYGTNSNFNSNSLIGFNNSLYIKLLDEEEKKKLKILEGYEKLSKIAKQLGGINLVSKNARPRNDSYNKEMKIKQYEELFELLEYKGINFSSKEVNNHNDFTDCERKVVRILPNTSRNKKSEGFYPFSISPKRNEDLKNLKEKNVKIKSGNDLVKDSKQNSEKKSQKIPKSPTKISDDNLLHNNSNKAINLLKPPKSRANINPGKPTLTIYNSPSTNGNSETGSKAVSLNNFNIYIDKLAYEKYPIISENSYSAVITDDKVDIDYDNYKGNLSTINVKENEEDNSNSNKTNILLSNNSENSACYCSDITNPIITLKPTETNSNSNNPYLFSSVSGIDYSSNGQHDFLSTMKDQPINVKSSLFSATSNCDDYQEYEGNLFKLNKCQTLYGDNIYQINESFGTSNNSNSNSNSNFNHSVSKYSSNTKHSHSIFTNSNSSYEL